MLASLPIGVRKTKRQQQRKNKRRRRRRKGVLRLEPVNKADYMYHILAGAIVDQR